MLGLIGNALGQVFGVIEESVTDKDEKNRLKANLQQAALDGRLTALSEAAETARAEITGESWLQRAWRPLTMLTFAGLIVARWLGLTVEGIDAQTEQALLDIVKVGLGGYVFGRSGEKMMREWGKAKKTGS